MSNRDTIVAVATPPGYGSVGIVRLSGHDSVSIAEKICSKKPVSREIIFTSFVDDTTNDSKEIIDQGLVLLFSSPASFTGEDVVEFQSHGSPVVLDLLCQLCIKHGARAARAGEFSERAFLNSKIDLAQAEAIADLIAAQSQQAAKAAMNSLKGDFSFQVNSLVEQLIQLRIYVESALDFPEEEIDFLNDGKIKSQLEQVDEQLNQVKRVTSQGRVLQEGVRIAIIGQPNAGKSSLLNQLTGQDSAIVTSIAGTTRDVLKENINIKGLPVNIIDTAGLRESEDIIEQEGIRRAKEEIAQADLVLYLVDSTKQDIEVPDRENIKGEVCLVLNKTDLTKERPKCIHVDNETIIRLSAKTGEGVDLLKDYIHDRFISQETTEGIFSSRLRHTEALAVAEQHITTAFLQLNHGKGELLAEELSQAQQCLASITGEFTSDDLLGRIFSEFCIGK